MNTIWRWLKKHEVTIVLCIGLLGIFVLPWLFIRPWFADFTSSGQIGDTIGGTTAPFIGLLSAWLVYRAFKAQIKANELISGQLKIEEQRYKGEKVKDIEEAQTTNFMKMYEAYVRALNGLSSVAIKKDINVRTMRNRDVPNSMVAYELNGRQFIEELIFTDRYMQETVCMIDLSKSVSEQISRVDLNEVLHWYQLFPLFRVTYHLLKKELAHDGMQKWDNIRFFRAQLTEPELNVLAMNILFDKEGREGLAVVAAKSGLFKHLKAKNLERLIKQQFPDTQAGFFDIKITERELKEQPFIFKKAYK